jgi:hypothetical protein
MSAPVSTFESQFNYDLEPLKYSNSTNGAGAITHLPNESAAQLSTGGTTSGDYAIMQTKRYHRYQTGKSQLILMTGNLGAGKANVRQRVGYFDAGNGLFFEQTETAKKIVVRTSTSGSPVDTAVSQSSWNLDTLDGTGASGITIDWAMSQIFMIDFEWLGTGRVRFGFIVDGLPVYCHEVLNANSITTVYMTTANLPVRTEIENTGTAASTTTLKRFCTSVISEGGVQEDIIYQFSAGRGVTSLGVTTRRPVLSLRPSVTFNSITNRGHVSFSELGILATTNNCLWELVLGGTLTGASWANFDATYSIADIDTSATAISGGVVIDRGWAIAGLGASAGRGESTAANNLELYNDFAGTTPDILSVVCTSFTGTANINALIKWGEQR